MRVRVGKKAHEMKPLQSKHIHFDYLLDTYLYVFKFESKINFNIYSCYIIIYVTLPLIFFDVAGRSKWAIIVSEVHFNGYPMLRE